jgi:hypothetical protein
MTICYKKSVIFLISWNSHFIKNSMNTKIKHLQLQINSLICWLHFK